MRIFKKLWPAVAFLVLCLPVYAGAQVTLHLPEDGAELTSPPLFAWEAEYNHIFFVSLFSYGPEENYHPFFFPLPFRESMMMSQRWWDLLTPDVPQYWLIVGFENPRQPVWSEVWSFIKRVPEEEEEEQ